VAEARGFAFSHMGEELAFEPGRELHVHTPQPAEIRLLRDGEIVATASANELHHPIERYGIHRVEVRLRNRPWIYSNPVYIRG
jgi:oxalate decarboxylase/phosphoglucose isomerase-like protein (cupin superfamily)